MSRTIDPFDELAAMFLSAPTPAAPPSASSVHSTATLLKPPNAAPLHRPESELLIVGHLPVRAGLWLTPFADAMAREQGATALVRLDVEEPSIQLIRTSEACGQAALGESVESAIDALGGAIDLWMIRGPVGSSPVELISAGVQQITILSSGDEAAVVAAYQLVKELALASEEAALPLPRIGVAVMGVELPIATGIVERLNRTTLSFLGVEVRMRACLSRMDAGIKSTRYASFPSVPTTSLAQTMIAIDRARSQPPESGAPSSDVAGRIGMPEPTAPVRSETKFMPSPLLHAALPHARAMNGHANGEIAATPASPVPVAPVAPVSPVSPVGHSSSVSSPSHQPPPPASARQPWQEFLADSRMVAKVPWNDLPVRLAPKPAVDVEEAVTPSEPDVHGQPIPLATHVGGLVPLPVRCPGHERVEFALDARGRMHLLIKETGGHSVRELRIVESWARAHRELIGMACPQHPINAALAAECHVFTDQPANLADLHGTEVRLHVLAPVTVNGNVGWYAAPLNAGQH